MTITCTNDQYRVSIKTTLMTAKPAHPMPTLDSPAQSLTESLCFPSIPPRIRSQHNTPRIDTCHMYFSSFPILIFMSYLAICIFLKDCQMSIMIYFHIVLFKMLCYEITLNIYSVPTVHLSSKRLRDVNFIGWMRRAGSSISINKILKTNNRTRIIAVKITTVIVFILCVSYRIDHHSTSSTTKNLQ